MNWLTAIKNFVVGAPQIATDVFDKNDGILVKAGGFINDLHYSDAEKVQDQFKIGAAVTEHVKACMGESTEKSKARRDIASLWIRVQLSLVLMTAICIPLEIILNAAKLNMAKSFFELATCNVMLWGSGSVITFFFGGYVWGTYIKKGKKSDG